MHNLQQSPEVWKDINGYEGLYQISNLGNVRSLDRTMRHCIFGKEHRISIRKGKLLKPGAVKDGYLYVVLTKQAKTKSCAVARLVAENFIPNSKSYLIVNHIDGNKKNNHVSNLEWCTHQYNSLHHFRVLGHKGGKSGKFGALDSQSHKVEQYDLDGNLIKVWDALREANRAKGYSIAGIGKAAKGKQKQYAGFVWKYSDEQV